VHDTPLSRLKARGRAGATSDHFVPFHCSVTAWLRPLRVVRHPTVKQKVRVAQDEDVSELSPGFWIDTIRQELPFQLSAMTEPREKPTAWHESGPTQDTVSRALIPAGARLTGNTMRHELPSQTSESVR
jgi:hypothetical protein